MGRGDRTSVGSGRESRRAGAATCVGDPSPRQIADEAASLQQQGERRKGLEAAAKFEAAIAKNQQALDTVVRQRQLHGSGVAHAAGQGVVSLEEAADIRSSLAECYQLLAEALQGAVAARPDAELGPEVERQAAAAAALHLTTALGHYACCHPAAVLTPHAPAVAAAAVAAADGAAAVAAHPPVFAAAAAAAAAATAAAASMPPEVAVNAGNCTASLAELLEEEAGRVAGEGPPATWLPLYDVTLRCYRSAAACYRAAVAREEDALTLSNLGDVLVQSGTCLYGVARAVREADPGLVAAALQSQVAATAGAALAQSPPSDWAAAREAEAQSDFAAAIAAYEAACSISDSSQGDDLPGLLCNWGSGLLSLAGCLQDPAARLPLLQQAASRLEQAVAFDRGDPAPLCSLGETLTAAGEAAAELATVAADAAAVQHWTGVAAGHLRAALERGYTPALTLRRDDPEAMVGSADTNLALVRLQRRTATAAATEAATVTAADPIANDGGGAGVSAGGAVSGLGLQEARAAVTALQSALARPERLGGWRQRCDVRYNLACALALAGREQEAHQLLAALLSCGAVRTAELAGDADLEHVQHQPWFQALLAD